MIAYAITDPSTLHFKTLHSDLKRFSTKANIILYRDKVTSYYASNAELFITQAKKYNFDKVLLHTEYLLAHKIKADGVHLRSTQFNDVEKAKALGLFVVISTHSLEEAQYAEKLGVDMVTFSPIFATPNKGEPKGIKALQRVVDRLSIPVIALGGMVSLEHIRLSKESGAKGFASIRWFQ